MKWMPNLLLGAGLLWIVLLAACDDGNSGLGPADGDSADGDTCLCAAGCDGNGECLDACEYDFDCPAGQLCREGQCQDSGSIVPDGDTGIDDKPDGDSPVDGDTTPQPDGDADEDGDYDIDFETDVPHDPENPWIQADPLYIDFGAVPFGSAELRKVTVSNIGGKTLIVDDIYLYYEQHEAEPELTLAHGALPLMIEPLGEAEITIAFRPSDMDEDEDLLVIHSNDPSEPNIGVELITGVKAFGQLTVAPLAVNFGQVRMGDHVQGVTITNQGGRDVLLTGLNLVTAGNEISIPNLPPNIGSNHPYALAPGDSLVLNVHYNPAAPDGELDEGRLEITSNDENLPRATVDISGSCCEPEIDVVPSILDFSSVNAGEMAIRCTTIKNLGCMALDLDSLAITDDAGGAFSWESRPDNGVVLDPDATAELCVRFAPGSLDSGSGMLEIRSNDADEPIVEVPLSSEVVPPDIACEPRTLDFGDVPIGDSATLSVTCRNTSPATLTIDGATITPDPGEFVLTTGPDAELPFEAETVIEVTYSPSDEGTDSGELSITSNDPDESPLLVALAGNGLNPNRCPVAHIEILEPNPPTDTFQNTTVTFNGAISYDPDNGDSIATYEWTLLTAPTGSASQLHTQGDPQVRLYLDKVGAYQVQLNVYDTEGLVSCEPEVITIESRPRPPEIVCEPAYLDYGEIPVGQSDVRVVTCRNTGYATLQISQYEIETPAAGVFVLNNTPRTELYYSESTFVEIKYTPDDVGDDLGKLRVHSDDPANPIVEVTLRGGNYVANQCPVAVAEITDPPADEIEQGDTVRLDARGSYDPDPGDGIYQYVWTLEQKPSGSTTEIRPWGYAQPSIYVDKAGFYRIRLDVKDNAEQLISCSPAYLEFTATVPPPDIVCSPLVINYGVVPIGDTQTETVICQNVGDGLLRISSIVVDTPQAGLFSLTNSPVYDLPPNSSTSLNLRYAPNDVANHSGRALVHSNDPDTPTVEISLLGNSYDPNNCPVADIAVTSPDLARLKPLDTVYFDGTGSYDPDAGDRIVEYIWTVESRPSGSSSQLVNPSSATPRLFIDLAGHYWIKLEVRDSNGQLSCAPAYLELVAIPREIIHIELTWDTREGDMDLHLVRPGGSLWESGDCFYRNLEPNWGQYGRPSLDIDDQHGLGPENINLDDPGNGTYKVYVHYYNSWGERDTVGVTVRIYIWGNLVETYEMDWPERDEHDRWHVCDISWNGSNATVGGGSTSRESDGHGQ